MTDVMKPGGYDQHEIFSGARTVMRRDLPDMSDDAGRMLEIMIGIMRHIPRTI